MNVRETLKDKKRMKNKSLVFNLTFTTGLALVIAFLCIFNVFITNRL